MTNSIQDLAVIDATAELIVRRPPATVLEEARKAAIALRDVIEAKPKKVMFNGEQYLEFEDWQTIARFYGITAKVTKTEYVKYGDVYGFSASAVALRADGYELSAAEAECLNDEEKWRSRTKYEWRNGPHGRERVKIGEEAVPLFQLKSMAQTRACAKVFRNVLAWVVVLAGYRATPAEELETQHQENETGQSRQSTIAGQVAQATAKAGSAAHGGPQAASGVPGGLTVVSVVRKQGKSAKGPWTRFAVKFSDGTVASTFDTTLGEQAEAAAAAATPPVVNPDLQKTDKGVDFKGWLPLAKAEEQRAPDEPVAGPEKVLTVRKMVTDHGDRWVIQTEKRELVTDVEAHATAAVEARKAKLGIVPAYETIAAASGRTVNRLTAFEVEAPAVVAREPGSDDE